MSRSLECVLVWRTEAQAPSCPYLYSINKANFENELQKIYVYKSQEKKRKDINDDLFRRIKEIDHKRNKKLREMFSK